MNAAPAPSPGTPSVPALPPAQLLEVLDHVPGALAPSTSAGLKALAVRLLALSQALEHAQRTGHRNLPRVQALHAAHHAAALAFQNRNGHTDPAARVLARAFLTPGLATGADARAMWLLGRHYGVLATVLDRTNGRRDVAVIGSRANGAQAPVVCAPVYAMPWTAQGQERFLSTLVHLDPGWAFVRLSATRTRRHSRLDAQDRQLYGQLLTSELVPQLCKAEPAGEPSKLAW